MILDNLRGSLGCATENANMYSQVTCINGATKQDSNCRLLSLLYNSNTSIVVGRGTDPVTRADYKLADEIIRNTYRTLLSRGQKGCYIYCEDKALREYIKSVLNKKY